jgi:Tol biopolymer transport system component
MHRQARALVRSFVPLGIALSLVSSSAAAQGFACTEDFESPGLPAGWSGLGSFGVTNSVTPFAPWSGARHLGMSSGGMAWPAYLGGVSGFGADLPDVATFLGVPESTIEGIVAGVTFYGSATKLDLQADAGETLTLRWNFLTYETPGEPIYRDFAAVIVVAPSGAQRYLLADTVNGGLAGTSLFGGVATGYRLFNHTFLESGPHVVTFSVYDVGDGLNDSALLVDLVSAPGLDTDADGFADCNDGCPTDPLKTAPGACGCGVADAAATFFRDADGDGYGTSADTLAGVACLTPAGYASIAGDCDDANAFINPGASETFNGLDDNCDGLADNGLAYASRVSVSTLGAQCNGDSRAPMVTDDGNLVAFKSLGSNLVPFDNNAQGDLFIRDLRTNVTELVSISSSGALGNAESYHPAPSQDGRYVAFFTVASNLISGDTNAKLDVLLRDRQLGTTTLVSKSTVNTVGNGDSSYPSISFDGNLIGFQSTSSNLVTGDTNGRSDAFVRNMALNTTVLASVGLSGGQSNGNSTEVMIAGNGRFVVFSSDATNLVAGDTNNSRDIFVRDLQLNTTVRVSVSSSGAQGNEGSDRPWISADGRFVVFDSTASTLVAGDTNNQMDVFLHDLQTSTTVAVTQGNGASTEAVISSDGGTVVFHSAASNLVAGDTNVQDDVFAWYRATGRTMRVSVNAAGQQGNGHSRSPWVSAHSRVIVYRSDSSNLVSNDTNAAGDCFANVPSQTFFLDADGDTFGTPAVSLVAATQPAGYQTNALDCDDTNATVRPGAPEICDGLDNDCTGVIDDGFLSTYCTAGTTVAGCTPSIGGVGAPSSTAGSGFQIVVQNVPSQKMGLVFYGQSQILTPQPWAFGSSSYLCVFYPIQRTGSMNSGGTSGACSGTLQVDFNQFMAQNPSAVGAPFFAGQVLYAQGWFRDPGAAKQTNLSNGLRFTLCQ